MEMHMRLGITANNPLDPATDARGQLVQWLPGVLARPVADGHDVGLSWVAEAARISS